MKMRMVLAGAVVAALAGLGLAPAARAADPAVVVQMQPVGKTLADVRVLAEKFGGKDALDKVNEGITEKLGEKGLSGLDLTRPVLGYLVNASDAENVGGVVIVPVSSEKEFLDLLKRAEIDAEEVKDAKGLYALEMPDGVNGAEKPIRLRFAGNNAYLSFNLDNAELATAKLVAPEKLVSPGETALLATRTYLQRLPKDFAEKNKEQMKQVKDMIDGLPAPEQFKEGFASILKLSERMNEQQYKEGDTYDLKVNLDPRSHDLVIDVALKGLAGTPLAKDIAARKATTNRFAGVLKADSIMGVATKLPLFSPEIRKLAVEGLKEGVKALDDKIPEPAKGLADAALAGLVRTVESGEFDFASSLYGPNAAGVYGYVSGVSFDDPSGLEKEVRAALKNLPEAVQGLVKFDAAKAGDVSIHTVTVGAMMPADAQKLLGADAVVAFAFAPKGIYVAVASDAVAQLKTAIAAKPVATPVMKVVTNGKRLLGLVEASGKELPEDQMAMFDKEDKQTTAASLTIGGGETLSMRFTLRLTPFFLVGAAKAK